MLTTIRSRTHHYPFRLIAPSDAARPAGDGSAPQEGVTVEPAVFPLVIRAGGGSARDSLSMLDQLLAGAGPEGVTYRQRRRRCSGVTDAALLDEMVDALAAGDGASVFGAVDKVVEAGHDPRRFATDLLQRLRDLVILLDAVPEAAGNGLIDAPTTSWTLMAAQAERLGPATLSRMAEMLHTGLVEMRGTTAPRLRPRVGVRPDAAAGRADGDGALLQRLERMERRMSIAADHATTPARPAGPPTPVAQPAATAPSAPPAVRPSAPPGSVPESESASGPVAVESARPTTTPVRGTRPHGPPPAASPSEPPPRGRDRPAAPAGPDLGLPAPPTLRSTRPGPVDRPSGGSREPAALDRPGDATTAARATESGGGHPNDRPRPTPDDRPTGEALTGRARVRPPSARRLSRTRRRRPGRVTARPRVPQRGGRRGRRRRQGRRRPEGVGQPDPRGR